MLKYANQPNLPPLLKYFVNHELAIRNRSELTVDEYALDLILFFRFLKQYRNLVPPTLTFEDIDISDIDIAFLRTVSLADAYAFLSYCKSERDNDAAARARKSSSIRAFFRYISVQQKLLDENPMQELETPKQKKAQPKYLTLEESMRLLDSVEGKFKERDYCILTLFLNCGLRLSELVSINYTDIKDNHTLVVTGKGNKQRTVYLNDACMTAIKNYMAVRPVDADVSVRQRRCFGAQRNFRARKLRNYRNLHPHCGRSAQKSFRREPACQSQTDEKRLILLPTAKVKNALNTAEKRIVP